MPAGERTSTAWRVAFGLAALVNVVAVYAPSDAGGGELFPSADKVGHLVLFALVALTGARAGLPLVPLALVLAVHAVTSEVVQEVALAGRAGDLWDAVADLAGTAVGLVLGRGRETPRGARWPPWRTSR